MDTKYNPTLPTYYTILPVCIRLNPKIILGAKLLWIDIFVLLLKNVYCYSTNVFFARIYGVNIRTANTWISNLKHLELGQKDLESDKNLFKTSAQKVVAYNQIWDEVERNGMSIDSEISAFNNNRFEGFTSRFNKFVGNVKKIVTAITTELNWYKATFKDFWHKTPKDSRNLADEMDRNKCGNFSDYNKKFYNDELDYQIQEKNQIRLQHIIRQKKINDAMLMSGIDRRILWS